MANFDITYRIIMANEGGYSNVSTDSGKETYRGISRRWHPTWQGWAIIDSIKTVRTIKQNEVLDIYELKILVKNFYRALWRRMLGDQLKTQEIADIMFDFFVLVDDDAVKMAQRIASSLGRYATVDGKMGQQTLNAVNSLNQQYFYDMYRKARETFHRNVAASNAATGAPNLKGWLNRLAKFPGAIEKKTLA
jgi:lysozyme family protein